MTRPRLTLAFDTTAAHCAAALLSGDTILMVRVDAMAKGQGEHLIGMLAEVLAAQGLGWPDLAVLGVGTGPGNFTGIRIAVAAARGLALGLSIPAIGVSGFDAAALGHRRPVTVAIPAPREMAYVQDIDLGAPHLLALRDTGGMLWPGPATAMIAATARIAATRAATPQPRPAPLYVRPPDAALSRDYVLLLP